MLSNFSLDEENSLRQWLKNVREGAGYSRIAEEGPAISGRRTCLPWDTIPESQCFHY